MHFTKLVVNFCTLTCIQSVELMLPKETNKKYLQHCIETVQRKYFKQADNVIFLNLNQKSLIVKPATIKIDLSENTVRFRYAKADAYVITISEERLQSSFRRLSRSSEWNPRAKFVIAFEGNIRELYKVLRKYYVYSVIVLISESTSTIKMVTYFPFDSDNWNEETYGEKILDECFQGKLQKNTNLFPQKLPDSWENASVKVAVIKYPPYVTCDCCDEPLCGIEVDIFNLVRSRLGFKAKIINDPYRNWGYKLSNGSYKGGCKGFQDYEFDIGFGAFFPNYTESWDFDLTFSYIEDSTNWIVPSSEREPHWKAIVKVFKRSTWYLISVCVFLIPVVLYISSIRSSELRTYKNFHNCLIVTYKCLFNQAVRTMPKTVSVRVTFAAWIIFSVIVTAAYQSNSTVLLNFNSYEKQISTVREIIESGLKFGFYDLNKVHFADSGDEIDDYIYKNYIKCSRGSECVYRTAFERDFATFKSKRYLMFMISEYFLDSDGRSLLHIIGNENVRVVHLTMVLSKGFPLYERINRLLIDLSSAGIPERHRKLSKHYRNKAFERARNERSKVYGLKMKDISGAFKLLFIGWIWAFGSFLIECFTKKYKMWIKVKR